MTSKPTSHELPPSPLDREGPPADIARRAFLRDGLRTGGLMGLLLGAGEQAIEVRPARAADAKAVIPVGVGVVGLGDQGRDLLGALARMPGAEVRALCDSFEGAHKRALELAKGAEPSTDYRKLLSRKDVQAVFVATPSHLHKDIAIAALQAGKHVYCEAPLASSIEDARAIAKAALANPKLVFQPGLQRRANTLDKSVFGFVKAGVLAKLIAAEGRYAVKNSWRRAASTPERERERNWRLDKALSGGLMGEVGIHQLDWMTWFMRALPLSVTGAGAIMAWNDGRELNDTVRCELTYPNGVVYSYRATLGSSIGGASDFVQGHMASVLMRGNRAWMLKEADAPALGWEVYATKEPVGDDSGIALVANATKLLDEGKDPAESKDEYSQGALHYGVETFLEVVRGRETPSFGAQEGFAATVVALTAHEATQTGRRIELKKELFALA